MNNQIRLKGKIMNRQAIDNTHTWFDIGKSTQYLEDTHFNGSNMISVNTGSQWDHEALYRTKSGSWILHCWSQWQGSGETWTLIDDETAAAWLVANNHETDDTAAEKAAKSQEI